jgi:hypothetical protein
MSIGGGAADNGQRGDDTVEHRSSTSEERRKRWTWRGVGTSPSEEDKEGGKPGSMVTRSVLIEEVGVVELGLRQPCERGKWGEGVSDESTHGGGKRRSAGGSAWSGMVLECTCTGRRQWRTVR